MFKMIGYFAFVLVLIIFLFLLKNLVNLDADVTLLLTEKLGRPISSLKGKVVWITGASSGIGECLAYEFAKAGCSIVLSARNTDALANVKRQCLAIGQLDDEDVLVLPMDVVNFISHDECVKAVIDKFGKIDILINNAGRSQRALIVDTKIAVDRDMIELNVLAPVSIVKKVLPHMLERNKGHVVIMSSIAGKTGCPNSATYSLTKFAVEGWHQALRTEMVHKNIDVTIVCPGPVQSKILENAFTGVPGESFGSHNNVARDFKRMSTERCAELVGIAVANRLSEVWISQQPALLMAYVAVLWPAFMPWFTKHFSSVYNKLRYGEAKQ